MRLLALALVVLLASCGRQVHPSYRRQIPEENRDAAAQWIRETAAAANPHSDEEPEDMLRELDRIAIELWGRPDLGAVVTEMGQPGPWVPCERLEPDVREYVEQWAKERP